MLASRRMSIVKSAHKVLVGADVFEILTIAMYAEPLVVYRELLQNAADGIERAIRGNDLGRNAGRIDVSFEQRTRTVSVVDNGFGLPNEEFDQQMASLGASAKRTDTYRGFRGIGRLAGIGHCRSLLFRSRSKGDRHVFEARWDAGKIRDGVLKRDVVPIEELTQEALTIASSQAQDEPEHFFEVKLEGVRRLADDRLFDPGAIADYLAQVAPVRFHPSFSFGEFIVNELERRTSLFQVQVFVAGQELFKPYRDCVEVKKSRSTFIKERPEIIEVPSTEDGLAALGWVAHTDYLGAFPAHFTARGLRVRSGNLQVGDETMLAKAFPEERFNAWALGEFHVFDPRLRPNARRDAFEPCVAVDDLFNQLRPYGNAIAKRCRQESKRRNTSRRIESIQDELDSLERYLHRNTTALADAVRKIVSEEMLAQLNQLAAGSHGDDDLISKQQLSDTRARVAQVLKKRGSKVLTARERGQLDVLSWLYGSGSDNLLGPAVAALKENSRKRTSV